jgi:hypothetical protein
MKIAARNDIIDLCKKHNRLHGDKHEVFAISKVVLKVLA